MRCKYSPSSRHLAFLRFGCCRGELRFGAGDRAEHIERAGAGRGLSASFRIRREYQIWKSLFQHALSPSLPAMAIIPYLALSLVDSRSGILRRAFLAAMARRGAGVPACAFRDVEVDIRAFGIDEFLHPPFARPEDRKRDFESTVFRAVLDRDKPLPALALCNGDAFAGFRAGQDDGLVIDRLQRLYDSNRRAFAYYELFRLAPFPTQSIPEVLQEADPPANTRQVALPLHIITLQPPIDDTPDDPHEMDDQQWCQDIPQCRIPDRRYGEINIVNLSQTIGASLFSIEAPHHALGKSAPNHPSPSDDRHRSLSASL